MSNEATSPVVRSRSRVVCRSRAAFASLARRASWSSTSWRRAPGERLDLGQGVGRKQHARLDELFGRQVVATRLTLASGSMVTTPFRGPCAQART